MSCKPPYVWRTSPCDSIQSEKKKCQKYGVPSWIILYLIIRNGRKGTAELSDFSKKDYTIKLVIMKLIINHQHPFVKLWLPGCFMMIDNLLIASIIWWMNYGFRLCQSGKSFNLHGDILKEGHLIRLNNFEL